MDDAMIHGEWVIGMIVLPIYTQKGNKDSTNNYRGITLLPCLGKSLTIQYWKQCSISSVMKTTILYETQTGIKLNYSTIEDIFLLQLLILDYRSWSHSLSIKKSYISI